MSSKIRVEGTFLAAERDPLKSLSEKSQTCPRGTASKESPIGSNGGQPDAAELGLVLNRDVNQVDSREWRNLVLCGYREADVCRRATARRRETRLVMRLMDSRF